MIKVAKVNLFLEWIAYCKVPGEAVFEWVEVEVAAAACVVGGV